MRKEQAIIKAQKMVDKHNAHYVVIPNGNGQWKVERLWFVMYHENRNVYNDEARLQMIVFNPSQN